MAYIRKFFLFLALIATVVVTAIVVVFAITYTFIALAYKNLTKQKKHYNFANDNSSDVESSKPSSEPFEDIENTRTIDADYKIIQKTDS